MPSFFRRYQAGEYIAVWNELMALGQRVREKKHYADAVAVGAETMRRARHNVELLIQRLAQMRYRFVAPSLEEDLEEWRQAMNPGSTGRVASAVWAGLAGSTKDNKARLEKLGKARAQMERIVIARCAALEAKMAAASKKSPLKNPDVFDPPHRQVAAQLNKLEKLIGGSMPISLRAWYEQVGAVSLIGAHEVLNPRGCEIADPLVVYPLDRKLSKGEFEDVADDDGKLEYYISVSDRTKANMLGGNFYSIIIPNAAADAPLENEWRQTTFVNYLRRTFAWGGFPGWERDTNPPRDLIARLTEGLLSL